MQTMQSTCPLPINPDIFPDYLFEPDETTNIALIQESSSDNVVVSHAMTKGSRKLVSWSGLICGECLFYDCRLNVSELIKWAMDYFRKPINTNSIFGESSLCAYEEIKKAYF